MAIRTAKAQESITWWLGIAIIPCASVALYVSSDFTAVARALPFLAAAFALGLALIHTAIGLINGVTYDDEGMYDPADLSSLRRQRVVLSMYALATALSVYAVGFHLSLPVALFLFIGLRTRRWVAATLIGAVMWSFTYIVLERTLHIILPSSLLRNWMIANGFY